MASISRDGTSRLDDLEELNRQKDLEETQIRKMLHNLRVAEVIEPPQDTRILSIGHIATIQRYEVTAKGSVKRQEPERYYIGGYGEEDPRSDPPTLSYTAPIIAKLIGQPLDTDLIQVVLGRQRFEVELLDIELPAQAHLELKKAS